jgi:hypothetical protein
MSPPIASEPLVWIVQQLTSDISRAHETCMQIRGRLKACSTRRQLEQLLDSLASGGSFVTNLYSSRNTATNREDEEVAIGEW